MLPIKPEASPIGFAKSAFAPDGEVDEANLFQPDDAVPVLDERAVVDREGSRELHDALDVLMAEVVAEANDEGDAVAAEQSEEEGELDTLDALLAESMAPVKEARLLKQAREKLGRGGLSRAERLEIEAKVREWEARVEWTAIANTALFTVQKCLCGSSKTMFTALMQRQNHRVKAGVQRWVSTERVMTDLENETATQTQQVPMCERCSSLQFGFDLTRAYPIDEPRS